MPTHTLTRLTPRTHWLSPAHATDRPILGVVTGSDATLIVDAGNSPAHAQALQDEITRLDAAPTAFVVLTHWHWDHVFGAATLCRPAVAQRETRRIVAKMAAMDWRDAALDQRVADGTEIAFCRDMIKAELPDRDRLVLRPPEIAFTARIEIDLGGVTGLVVHVGGDHAPDSCIVHVPEERVVFLGDCIYRDLHHGPDRYTTGTLFPLLERLRDLDADHYVAAHHDGPLTRAGFFEETRVLEIIGRTVAEHDADLDAAMAALAGRLDTPLTDTHREIADAFIAGVRMPNVEAVF